MRTVLTGSRMLPVLLKMLPERRYERLVVRDDVGVTVGGFTVESFGAAVVFQALEVDLTAHIAHDIGGLIDAEPLIPAFGGVQVGVGEAIDRVKQAAAHREVVKAQHGSECGVARLGVSAATLHCGAVPDCIGAVHVAIMLDLARGETYGSRGHRVTRSRRRFCPVERDRGLG